MLKRIAVVGKNTRLQKAAAEASRSKEVAVVRVDPREELPPATAVVIAGSSEISVAVEAALVLGERHEQLLLLLAEAIDCREAFMPGSSVRVQDLATSFARALGLNADDQLTLERGALVRDIGKLKIPNEILLKDALLTYDEWDTIRQHTNLGANLVLVTDVLKDTVDIVRYHHECFDGSGYPEGLEREKIPLPARIMKILDVYCAMTSPRHYRERTSSREQALAHLQDEVGKQFDPELVRVFVEASLGETNTS
ncbi:MAG: HD domain-containing protein [Candidatus Hydrogenedentes bacterium]|nr:HD domain-containing protein [Candidatus Hydrogenedentota bacterium]